MAISKTKRVLVPRLHCDFEEPTVNFAILEAFQRLGYDRPTEDQALALACIELYDKGQNSLSH